MKKRKTSQKIAFFFAIFCYLLSLASLFFGAYWWNTNDTNDPIFASAVASIIFFTSCGGLLHFVASVNLVDMSFKSD